MFHGSYASQDVTFLLRVIEMDETPIDVKEEMVGGGRYHYSELISPEYRPDDSYMELFHRAMRDNLEKTTRHHLALAEYIAGLEDPVIVSLARAGTPVGVILRRMLQRFHERDIPHYSISIIKERGMDMAAMRHIRSAHPSSRPVFVDGWASKGSIRSELKSSMERYRSMHGDPLDDSLHVLSDISGSAEVTASHEDYLIPSSILNSIVSGLVSRSIFTRSMMLDGGFHGCKYYENLSSIDLSRWYVDTIMAKADLLGGIAGCGVILGGDSARQIRVRSFLEQYAGTGGGIDTGMLKLGIGETTRALLRRIPRRLVVRDAGMPEVRHLLHLASDRGVPYDADPELPFVSIAELSARN